MSNSTSTKNNKRTLAGTKKCDQDCHHHDCDKIGSFKTICPYCGQVFACSSHYNQSRASCMPDDDDDAPLNLEAQFTVEEQIQSPEMESSKPSKLAQLIALQAVLTNDFEQHQKQSQATFQKLQERIQKLNI